MSKEEKWIIVIENDCGEYAVHGWWETGINVIHPYEYNSSSDAMRAAFELSKDVGNCKVVQKHEREEEATK